MAPALTPSLTEIPTLCFGFTLGFAILTIGKAGSQTLSVLRRKHNKWSPYVLMIWVEILVCLAMAILSWLWVRGDIQPKFARLSYLPPNRPLSPLLTRPCGQALVLLHPSNPLVHPTPTPPPNNRKPHRARAPLPRRRAPPETLALPRGPGAKHKRLRHLDPRAHANIPHVDPAQRHLGPHRESTLPVHRRGAEWLFFMAS